MVTFENSSFPTTPSTLPGLGRALVASGKLAQSTAEDLFRKAAARRSSFIGELIDSGAVSAADLAHIMSTSFAAPLIDLNAIDPQRLPKGLLEIAPGVTIIWA